MAIRFADLLRLLLEVSSVVGRSRKGTDGSLQYARVMNRDPDDLLAMDFEGGG